MLALLLVARASRKLLSVQPSAAQTSRQQKGLQLASEITEYSEDQQSRKDRVRVVYQVARASSGMEMMSRGVLLKRLHFSWTLKSGDEFSRKAKCRGHLRKKAPVQRLRGVREQFSILETYLLFSNNR